MSDINATDLLFSDLGLPAPLDAAVAEMGFEHPTAIQAQAIPPLLDGNDVVGVAQTGTGKTAAFGLPLLAHIDAGVDAVQALVLAPTRELAMQGADALEAFARRSTGVNVVAVYGGSAYGPQLRALEEGAQVVVGTPGRIMDLMRRDKLTLDQVRYFVLDEADEMLRMGFAEDVETIASALPHDRISALFSATMPPAIRRVADQHLTDPVEVTVSRPASTVSTIHQSFAVVPHRHKSLALARILAVSDAQAVLVFVATRAMAEELSLDLAGRGVPAAALSGDVAQKDREKLVSRLRSGHLDVIVATDVAARGLDVDRIGLVVNFDLPRETDTYVHRIGRTGRAGRQGEAITLVTPREVQRLRRIEKATKASLEEVKIPATWEVARHRAQRLIEDAQRRASLGKLDVYADVLAEYQASRDDDSLSISLAPADGESEDEQTHFFLSDGQLLAALLALGTRDTGMSEEPEVIASDSDSPRSRREKPARPIREGYERYRVEVGHKDRVKPGALVGAIAGEGGIAGSRIGHIDIYPTFSLVDIEGDLDDEQWHAISRARVAGRELRISVDRGPRGRASEGERGEERRRESLGRRSKPKRSGARYGARRDDSRRGRYGYGASRHSGGSGRSPRSKRRRDSW